MFSLGLKMTLQYSRKFTISTFNLVITHILGFSKCRFHSAFALFYTSVLLCLHSVLSMQSLPRGLSVFENGKLDLNSYEFILKILHSTTLRILNGRHSVLRVSKINNSILLSSEVQLFRPLSKHDTAGANHKTTSMKRFTELFFFIEKCISCTLYPVFIAITMPRECLNYFDYLVSGIYVKTYLRNKEFL